MKISFLLFLLAFPFLVSVAYASASAAPWVPSRGKTRKLILDHIHLGPGDHFVELGCGDARILLDLARHYPLARFTGYELSLPLVIIAKLKCLRYRNIHIRFKSAFRFQDSSATHVFMFLTKGAYATLTPQLLLILLKGTHLYAEAWPLPNLSPTTVLSAPKTEKIFHYIV